MGRRRRAASVKSAPEEAGRRIRRRKLRQRARWARAQGRPFAAGFAAQRRERRRRARASGPGSGRGRTRGRRAAPLAEIMTTSGKENFRLKSYKNKSLNPDEMRRRREEEGLQLRKQKREEQLFKRRNVATADEEAEEEVMSDGGFHETQMNNMEMTSVSPCLSVLSWLLFVNDTDVLADACWALSYLSDGPNDKIQAVIDAGVCRRLVELLMHNDYKVVSPALRAVGNIVTGDDIQTQVILNCSALQSLLHLLSSPKESIKKEACWTISNITAGNRAQIQTVIDANIFPALISILQTAEFRTRKEAAWAITNATSGGSAEQIKYLVELGCIKPLCDLLTVMDSKIVQVALNGLENILRLGEQEARRSGTGINPYCALIEEAYGLDKIEFLQSHENQEIYQKAFDLIEHYFGTEEEDSSIAPQVDLGQQQYIFQQCEAPMEGFQL
ncbi:importin subunit alpha-5 [Podarcis lilfordi]|uniref:Importin subunit alpha n=1 Tax=Podarcis lilfordi TaxID=74358 RepID=A0AA35LIQ0_9SAUR|nr:importin subunit alpha-5 [Podarcis lilfordi]